MFLSLGLLGLLGCPLPPEEQSSNTVPSFQNGNAGNGGKANTPGGGAGKPKGAPPSVGENQAKNNGTPPTNAGGDAGGAVGAAGGTLMDMEQMKSQKRQEEIEKLDMLPLQELCKGNVPDFTARCY